MTGGEEYVPNLQIFYDVPQCFCSSSLGFTFMHPSRVPQLLLTVHKSLSKYATYIITPIGFSHISRNLLSLVFWSSGPHRRCLVSLWCVYRNTALLTITQVRSFFFSHFVLFAHSCIFSFCKSMLLFIFVADSVNNIDVFYQKQIEKPSAKQVFMAWEWQTCKQNLPWPQVSLFME